VLNVKSEDFVMFQFIFFVNLVPGLQT